MLIDLLQRQLEVSAGTGIVFPTVGGEPMRRSNFRRRHWVPATKKIGVPDLRFHDLRHTSVAIAVAHGAHPKAISERLGHSSISITLQAALDRTDNVSKLG